MNEIGKMATGISTGWRGCPCQSSGVGNRLSARRAIHGPGGLRGPRAFGPGRRPHLRAAVLVRVVASGVFAAESGRRGAAAGAGLCPATSSRSRRRDGGDGATARGRPQAG